MTPERRAAETVSDEEQKGSDIVQTRYGSWDRENDPCPGCGDGDKVPVGVDFICPVCDAQWLADEEDA